MTEDDAEKYLRLLGQELQKQGITGEILVHNDINVLLDIKVPEITDAAAYLCDDIDTYENISAYFGGYGTKLKKTAQLLAEREGLHNDWLRLAIKSILSQRQEMWVEYPQLRIYEPSLEYVFTMKAIANDSFQEEKDVEKLVKELGIHSQQNALSIVKKYIPRKLLTKNIQMRIKHYFNS